MKRILSIYINREDKEIIFPKYLGDKQFIISICPESLRSWELDKQSVKNIKEKLEEGCILGQRGNKGECYYIYKHKYEHYKTDPWHENFCLYNLSISLEEQLKFMNEGLDLLIKTFHPAQVGYAPINHLFDENTIKATKKIGYSFMMDQNNFGLPLYEKNGLIIIPESKIGDPETKESVGIYSHFDMLKDKKVEDYIKQYDLVLPNSIKPKKVSKRLLIKNEIKKRDKKYERDKKLENK